MSGNAAEQGLGIWLVHAGKRLEPQLERLVGLFQVSRDLTIVREVDVELFAVAHPVAQPPRLRGVLGRQHRLARAAPRRSWNFSIRKVRWCCRNRPRLPTGGFNTSPSINVSAAHAGARHSGVKSRAWSTPLDWQRAPCPAGRRPTVIRPEGPGVRQLAPDRHDCRKDTMDSREVAEGRSIGVVRPFLQ